MMSCFDSVYLIERNLGVYRKVIFKDKEKWQNIIQKDLSLLKLEFSVKTLGSFASIWYWKMQTDKSHL